MPLSPLVLGTADWPLIAEADLDRLYCRFRKLGGTSFDTAHCYAFWLDQLGTPERQLGSLIRKHESNRDAVRVITKGGHVPYPKYDRPEFYMAPEVVERDLRESLERLGTRIDLYLLHRDDPRIPADEHLHMLQPFLANGLVGGIGVSNWLPDRVEAAHRAADRHGWQRFEINQVLCHLAHKTDPASGDPTTPFTTADHLAWYERTKFPMLAYSATANGFFAAGRSKWGNYDNPISEKRLERARAIANARNATPTQIALAWLLNAPWPCHALFATRQPPHLEEAFGALHLRLTPEERAHLYAF